MRKCRIDIKVARSSYAFLSSGPGAISMDHYHSLTCKLTGQSMNHMTWQPRLSTKRWQEAKTFALLHCGQITWNHIVFRINKTGQARINILTSIWTFLPFLDCTGTVQAVEQMSQLLWWPRGDLVAQTLWSIDRRASWYSGPFGEYRFPQAPSKVLVC